MQRIIPLGLTLIHSYCPLTLDNIFKFSFITVAVVAFISIFLLFPFKFKNNWCNLHYFCCSKMFLFNIVQLFCQK